MPFRKSPAWGELGKVFRWPLAGHTSLAGLSNVASGVQERCARERVHTKKAGKEVEEVSTTGLGSVGSGARERIHTESFEGST